MKAFYSHNSLTLYESKIDQKTAGSVFKTLRVQGGLNKTKRNGCPRRDQKGGVILKKDWERLGDRGLVRREEKMSGGPRFSSDPITSSSTNTCISPQGMLNSQCGSWE